MLIVNFTCAGFDNPVDAVMADLLDCLDNPGLALLQWDEVFSVVEVLFWACRQLTHRPDASH